MYYFKFGAPLGRRFQIWNAQQDVNLQILVLQLLKSKNRLRISDLRKKYWVRNIPCLSSAIQPPP